MAGNHAAPGLSKLRPAHVDNGMGDTRATGDGSEAELRSLPARHDGSRGQTDRLRMDGQPCSPRGPRVRYPLSMWRPIRSTAGLGQKSIAALEDQDSRV